MGAILLREPASTAIYFLIKELGVCSTKHMLIKKKTGNGTLLCIISGCRLQYQALLPNLTILGVVGPTGPADAAFKAACRRY